MAKDNFWTRASEGGAREQAAGIIGRGKAYSGWNLIKRFIITVLSIVIAIAFFGLIIVGALFAFNLFTGGGAGLVKTEAQVGLEETGAGRQAAGFFKNIRDIVINPELAVAQAGTFETQVRKDNENENLGVFLEDIVFNSAKKLYDEGRPITGKARLRSESLLEESNVKVTCRIKGVNTIPSIFVSGLKATGAFTGFATLFDEGVKNYQEIIIFKGKPSINTVLCEFKEGLFIKDIPFEIFELKSDKDLATLIFEVIAVYPFETRTFSRVYYMNNEALREVFLDPENTDPFEKFGIKDSLIQRDGTIKPEPTTGPIQFSIYITDPQPLTNEGEYFLEVGIIPSSGTKWKGDLKQVDSLEIHIPNRINLQEENCDFQNLGSSYTDEEGKFTVYTLKAEQTARVNKVCEDARVENETTKIISDTCLDKLKKEPPFVCRFTLEEVDNIEPEFTYIRGKVNYVFQTSKADTINIIRRQSSVEEVSP
ncbi:MAG: hypothetical protein HYS32_01525 [Candidatus Woesearchaeota archaeon]|nr:MAG: hypothetical protein HYS32_01525 [Candidatus Woesearchaeota archaeon]